MKGVRLLLVATVLAALALPGASEAARRRPPDIQVPASLDCGVVTPNTSSVCQLQIDNVGQRVLNVDNIVSDDPAFVPLQTTASVSGGSFALIDVQFTPPGADIFSAVLTITSNDPNEPEVGVDLVGIGDGPNIQVSDTLDFGDVGSNAVVLVQLRVDNIGTQPLSVTDIASDDPTTFEPQQTTATIAPGSFELVDVEVSTQAFGSYSGALTVTSNDPDQPTALVSMTAGPVEMFVNAVDMGTGDGGGLGTLRVFYLFADGSLLAASGGAGNLPAFVSSDPSVVSVLTSGNLVVNGPGTATLTASVVNLVAQATATVDPQSSSVLNVVYFPSSLFTLEVGETLQLTAFGIDAGNLNNLDNVEVVSDSPSVLSVDSVTMNGETAIAQLRGVSSGQAQLTIRSLDDLDVFQTVQVHVTALSALEITPPLVSFPVSGVQTLVARARASDGVYSFGFSTGVQWSSDAPAVAPVFPNGNVVGLAVGTAVVTAVADSDPSIQATVDVTVSSAVDLPQVSLRGIHGEDIVANGIDMGTAHYGVTQGAIVSAPRVEQVFIVDSLGPGAAQVVYVDTSTTHLEATSLVSGPIVAGRIGAFQVLLTIPQLGGSDPGPTSGTVTVFTNDPANPQISLPVSWSWLQESGEVADASTALFIDYGDIPQGASRDRTFVFELFEKGPNKGVLDHVTLSGSAFSLLTPNPNPFMSEGFPVVQANDEVPLTFTVRATPGAGTGTFEGIVSFATDDADEPLLEALVVAYGAPVEANPLPGELAYAAGGGTWLRTPNGSDLSLVPVPSGSGGLEYDASSGVAYLYSGSAFAGDPNPQQNNFDAYLFKVVPGSKPVVITENLSADPVGLAVNFSQNLSYVINLQDVGGDQLLEVSDSGSSSVLVSDGFTSSSRLGIDTSGNLYASRVLQGGALAITKYSAGGAQLLRFSGTSPISDFEVAADRLYTDVRLVFNTDGIFVGLFNGIPDFLWFTVDAATNILFGENVSSTLVPQPLILEVPSGAQQDAGELPGRAEQADF